MKVGLVFAVLNNFKGFTEAVWSAKSDMANLQVYVQPQWRAQVSLAAAWNRGAHEAFKDGCDFAIVCNDDILFAPECIDNMIKQYLEHRESGVIMVTPNNIKAELMDPYDILQYKVPDDPFTISDHPNFSCFLIKPEFFTLHGEFDENFWPAWYEDNDSHRRAQLLGFREICATAAPMVHFGGVSTSMIDNPHSGESQAYYMKKWGGLPMPASETFQTPYNRPDLSPKEWVRQ